MARVSKAKIGSLKLVKLIIVYVKGWKKSCTSKSVPLDAAVTEPVELVQFKVVIA